MEIKEYFAMLPVLVFTFILVTAGFSELIRTAVLKFLSDIN